MTEDEIALLEHLERQIAAQVVRLRQLMLETPQQDRAIDEVHNSIDLLQGQITAGFAKAAQDLADEAVAKGVTKGPPRTPPARRGG